jgi:hypothetical protein
LKRASKPTKTLEGIKKTGTIDISDDEVASEFSRFMKETDPKGHKKLEQTVDLMNLDPKGKKGHASGGLAGMRVPYQTGAAVGPAVEPFAKAEKAAAITEARGRSVPFENYYVGTNPTAEQASFMQEKGAAPLDQRMRGMGPRTAQAPGILSQLGQALNPSKETVLQRLKNQNVPKSQLKPMASDYSAKAQELAKPYIDMATEAGYGNVPGQIQGIGSDVRHTVGASMGKDALIDYVSQPAFLNINPEGKIANIIGNVGIGAATIGQELQDAYKSLRAGEGLAQPLEDVKANWSAMNLPYGSTEQEKLDYAIAQSPSKGMIPEAAAATPTKPTMADVAGPAIPEYYRKNPADYDYDKFKQAYAKALDARYGTGQGGGTTTVGPLGQISTSFGSWDPSRTYSAYKGDTRTSGSGPFYDPTNPDDMTMASVMKSMYGAPGAGKAYFNSGGVAGMLGE